MVQSNVLPGAFTHFMEIPDGAEPHFSQETVDDLILLAQEFEHDGLIANWVPQRNVPRHEKNVHDGEWLRWQPPIRRSSSGQHHTER
jgi:hypothetical protein